MQDPLPWTTIWYLALRHIGRGWKTWGTPLKGITLMNLKVCASIRRGQCMHDPSYISILSYSPLISIQSLLSLLLAPSSFNF